MGRADSTSARARDARGTWPEATTPLEHEVVRALRTGRAAMPVLPAVAQSALRIASDPTARVEEMVRLVDTDPPIAARFMSVANAVSFFRGALATSTRSAIVRLGLANTRDLLFQVVYASSAGDIRKYQSEVRASFERSVATAVAARTIASTLGLQTDLDYMCGLLHDIGEARIFRILDECVTPVAEAHEIENVVRKYHCAAGAELAETWRLPRPIVEACAHHHDAEACERPHVRLVRLADAVVSELRGESAPSSLESLGVGEDAAQSLLAMTRAALAKTA